jgi:hypothetical protein
VMLLSIRLLHLDCRPYVPKNGPDPSDIPENGEEYTGQVGPRSGANALAASFLATSAKSPAPHEA